MSETPPEFSFMARLEGYSGAIEKLDAAEFGPGRTWAPTEEHGALRIRFEHGAVLIAAKGTTVQVSGGASHKACGL